MSVCWQLLFSTCGCGAGRMVGIAYQYLFIGPSERPNGSAAQTGDQSMTKRLYGVGTGWRNQNITKSFIKSFIKTVIQFWSLKYSYINTILPRAMNLYKFIIPTQTINFLVLFHSKPVNMQFQSIFLTLLVGAGLSNAVVVDLFDDTDCNTPAGSRNVYDNSCAPLGGFQSYRITNSGGSGQQLSAYSRNACAGAVTSCTGVAATGGCIRATNDNGGSNAMSSSPVCGAV